MPDAPAGHDDLAARLAAWIDREGIKGNYDTPGIAARVTAQNHAEFTERHLSGGTSYLRHMCRNIKDEADMTPGEWLAEQHFFGHLAAVPRGAAA